VVALGVNDVTRLVPRRTWLDRRRRLNALIRSRSGARLIVASGLPPMHRFPLLPQPLRWTLGAAARRLDAALAALDDPGHVHLPLAMPFAPEYVAEDGFHPSPAAYALWAEALAGAIRSGAPDLPDE
jgi:lysophospholipase L1-like esterase